MMVSFAPLQPDTAEFLTRETGIEFRHVDFAQPQWFCVTARRWDGQLQGVAVAEFKTWFDAYFSTAIVDQRCMSRRLLRTIFQTLFRQAVRVTAEVAPDNERAIGQMRRMGFVYEGFKRMGVEGHRDALLFGMLREDCRFLPGWHPARTSIIPVALGEFHGLQS